MALTIEGLMSAFSLNTPNLWKLLAVFFALLNLKQLPFVWHLRVFSGFLQHFPLLRKPHLDARSVGPSALFRPLILASRVAPLECDYNLHKSNSTYFADFDIGRMHLLMCLCRRGIFKTGLDLWEKDGRKGPKRLGIMMGGVNINFRREIKPGQAFEMWTRVLTWDRKWIYTITHFVKKGAVKPKGWLLQPWRNNDKTQTHLVEEVGQGRNGGEGKEEGNDKRQSTHPAVFATGIAKYVAKRGRLTIPTELILQNSGLLPPKPKDHETPPVSETPAMPVEGDALPSGGAAMNDITSENAESLIDDALKQEKTLDGKGERDDGEEWTWEKVEKKRLEGMQIAEKWNMTEGLSELFDGERGTALGKYWDIPETLKGGIGGGIVGLGLGALGVYGAAARFPAFRSLTVPLRAFLVTSSGTFAAIISADHFSRAYEKAQHPEEQFEDSAAKARAERRSRESNYERFMSFGKEYRYKIVGVSWVASMAAALTIVGRSPYLSTTQKLVQARVYAQGLTIAVLIATAVFEVGDRNKQEGRWETVQYADPNDPEGKTREKRVHHESYRGEDQWRDMVEAEEQKQEARMAAIHEQEEQDRKSGKLSHKKKEHHDSKKQKVKDEHGENKEQVEKDRKQKNPDQGKSVRG
ncbi:MAG: hypothetical protein Q9169_007250 [Polycauliona sp. 2 TL-2023]